MAEGNSQLARLAHILESGLYSDVTFVVGKEKKEILGHKLLLRISSAYFENLFATHQEKNKFELPDIDELIYRQFLSFAYTGEWSQDPTIALPMLNAANTLQVPDLAKSCQAILKDNLNEENALFIFCQAATNNYNDLKQRAKETIFRFAYNLIDSEEFLTLSEENLEELIKSDELAVKDEVQLFDALVRWAEVECLRQNHPINSKCYGSHLQKLIPLVRFPQMDEMEFASSVAFREILTPEQMQACTMAYFYRASKIPTAKALLPETFNAAPRNYYLPKTPCTVVRLPTVAFDGVADMCGFSDKIIWDRISFMADQKIWMTSVMLNPHDWECMRKEKPDEDNIYNVDVKLEDEDLQNVYAVTSQSVKGEENSLKFVPIEFEKPIKIQKNVWYTVSLRVSDGYLGYWCDGEKDFAVCKGSDGNEVKIHFRNSKDTKSFTRVQSGQLAQFGFLLY